MVRVPPHPLFGKTARGLPPTSADSFRTTSPYQLNLRLLPYIDQNFYLGGTFVPKTQRQKRRTSPQCGLGEAGGEGGGTGLGVLNLYINASWPQGCTRQIVHNSGDNICADFCLASAGFLRTRLASTWPCSSWDPSRFREWHLARSPVS